jgi:hypothetical protein
MRSTQYHGGLLRARYRCVICFYLSPPTKQPFPNLTSKIIDVMMFQRSSTYIMSYKNGLSVALAGVSSPRLFIISTNQPLQAGLYSEYGPPADIADRLLASYPHYMSIGMGQRTTRARQVRFSLQFPKSKALTMSQQRDLLDALRSRGFQLNDGIHGTGFGFLAWSRAGVIISVFSPQVLSPFYDHPF